MSLNEGIAAAQKLVIIGYRFTVQGDTIIADYQSPDQPDATQVRPLLEAVKEHKEEVLFFLRCHCPRCGGVVYGTFDGREVCMGCYYRDLRSLMPGLDLKH